MFMFSPSYGESFSAIEKIPIPTPDSMAIDEKDQRLFITHSGRMVNNLSIFDTTTNSLIQQKSLLIKNAHGIHFNEKTNILYVLDYSRAGHVLVIDASSYELLKKIEVDPFPSTIITTRSGDKVFVVSSETPSNVLVINTNNFEVETIPVSDNPWSLSLDEAANKLFVTHPTSISVINIQEKKVINSISSTSSSHVYDSIIDTESNKLYALNYGFTCRQKTGTVMVIDSQNDKMISSIHVGFLPNSIAMDYETKRLFVANEATNNITIIDTSFENNPIQTITIDNSPIELLFSEKTGQLYVLDSTFLSVIDTR